MYCKYIRHDQFTFIQIHGKLMRIDLRVSTWLAGREVKFNSVVIFGIMHILNLTIRNFFGISLSNIHIRLIITTFAV